MIRGISQLRAKAVDRLCYLDGRRAHDDGKSVLTSWDLRGLLASGDELLRNHWAAFLSFGFKPLMDFGTSMKVQLDTVGRLLTLEAACGYRWHQVMSC